MALRIHRLTAMFLLTTWPLMLGLATGWHTHTHCVNCEQSDARGPDCEHHHTHGGGHHHHSHSHLPGATEDVDSHDHPTPPHDSENCHSCQLLALTGVVSQALPALPALPFCDSREVVSVEFPELVRLEQFHLRGPPAGMRG